MNEVHDKKRFTENLLRWYAQNARELPWRKNASPYRVWVSEIMLQQTRVEAVKPYFERFMQALPTIYDLAQAEDDLLKKLWEGLGYYNRVKNMKKCAQVCVELYGGNLPDSYEELLKLPGIGSYTAGAIASIAFHQSVPAVDGNVLRVFSRVLVSEDDILSERTKKKFQEIIKEYIPPKKGASFNQALMEIGALVCVPNAAPKCSVCPLSSDCIGYQSKQAERLPKKKAKKSRRIERKTVLVILHEDKVLLRRRKEEGLLSGLYEFMNVEERRSQKEVLQMMERFSVKHIQKLHPAKHIFSHVEWHMEGYLLEVEKKAGLSGVWCTKEDVEHAYALPTAFKAYREALYLWWKVKEV